MARPRKRRLVHHAPVAVFFKPQGVPLQQLKGVTLSVDGLEALRLADAEGLDQETAAAMMNISRPTFSRLVAEARATVAKALANGWAIRIEGGAFEMTAQASLGRDAKCRRGHKGVGRPGADQRGPNRSSGSDG